MHKPADDEQPIQQAVPAFAAAIVATDDAVITESLGGMVLSWNSGAQRVFGYPAAEIVGRSITRLFPPDRLHEEAELNAQVLRGEEVSHFETQRLRKDGSKVDIRVTLSPIRDARGSIVAISKVARDITTLKRLQASLGQATSDLQMIMDHSPWMVSYWNSDATNRFANKAYANALGLTVDDLRGCHVQDVLGTELYEKTKPFLDKARAGIPQSFERATPLPDGRTRHDQVRYVPDMPPGGGSPGVFVFVNDITERKLAEQALAESAARFQQLYETTPAMMHSIDAEGRLLVVSGHWLKKLGYCREEVIGRALTDFLTFASRVIFETDHLAAFQQGRGDARLEYQMICRSGEVIDVVVSAIAERDVEGRFIKGLAVVEDVTARKAAEQALRSSDELMRVTLDSIGDAVITTDVDGLVQWLNPVAAQLTGWSIGEACGRPMHEVFNAVDEKNRRPASSPVTRALNDDRSAALPAYTVLIARDGTEREIEESAAPIRNAEGSALGVVLVFHDVSEQRRSARQASLFRASHDELTGLINRAEFEVCLKNALTDAHDTRASHALMFIDLDQFKIVNDACGHAVGDQLLRQITALFTAIVRSRDTLARLGGDEFGVIMEHCTVAQAQRVAGQLCESMENFRFVHGERRFRVGASVGLVPLDSRWTDVALLLQAADASCYAAKQGGRNRVHEWVDTDERMKERHWETQWVSRLEEALDDNRFALFGQRIAPCAAMTSGLSLEVLLRLTNADGTLIAPALFLPAAERFHMASRIDQWVVREVLDWMGQIPLEGVDTIAINLSGQSIGDKSFHRYLIDLISHLSFDPRKLCFEITETAAITHLGEAGEFIRLIRALGVRIALDDFGAGASSFGYLKHLMVDILKIDGQFVRDLLKDPLDRTAVRCFRDVAQVCGLQSVAEFVENEEIFAELRTIGVDLVQGFLIHRPESLEHLLPPRATSKRSTLRLH